jgi:hypothetical protein
MDDFLYESAVKLTALCRRHYADPEHISCPKSRDLIFPASFLPTKKAVSAKN